MSDNYITALKYFYGCRNLQEVMSIFVGFFWLVLCFVYFSFYFVDILGFKFSATEKITQPFFGNNFCIFGFRCEEIASLMEEEGERGPDEGYLLVRVHVPELNVQKCLQFPRDQLVWDVKQQCLAALPKVSNINNYPRVPLWNLLTVPSQSSS